MCDLNNANLVIFKTILILCECMANGQLQHGADVNCKINVENAIFQHYCSNSDLERAQFVVVSYLTF